MIRLSWDLPAEAEHVRLCRHLVRVVMEHMVAEEQEIEEIELAVGELCANVVRHAQLSPGHSYLVDLEVREDSLVFSVSDMGVGFVPEVTADPTPTDSGGLGLWLVSQLTDHLELKSLDGKGTVVRAERHLKRPGRPSPKVPAASGSPTTNGAR